MTRDARAEADALLREAAAQADLTALESRALYEAVREIQQQARDLGSDLQRKLERAHKEIQERTSVYAVQARLRSGEETTALGIAEHLARILKADGALPPGEENAARQVEADQAAAELSDG